MPNLDVTGAAARMLAQRTNTPGQCLHYEWLAVSQGRVHYLTGGADTAYNTFENVVPSARHTNRDVPRDYPTFLGPRVGSPDGDVILSRGDGTFVATDYPSAGRIGICTLAQREAQTGRKFVGWTTMQGGHTLTSTNPSSDTATLITPAQQPIEQEPEMHPLGVVYQIVNPKGGLAGVKLLAGPSFTVMPSDSVAAFFTGLVNHTGIDKLPDFAGFDKPIPISQDNAELLSLAYGPTLPGGTLANLWNQAKTSTLPARYPTTK